MVQAQLAGLQAGLAPGRARLMQASVQAAVDCALCPDITPERGVEILVTTGVTNLSHLCSATAVVRRQAHALVSDATWRQAALDWISGFWAEHGHGPTWSKFLAADLWPQECPKHVRRTAMAKLYQRGFLDGTKTPFGLKASSDPRPRRRPSDSRRSRLTDTPRSDRSSLGRQRVVKVAAVASPGRGERKPATDDAREQRDSTLIQDRG